MAKKQFVDEIWNAGRSVAKTNGYYNNKVNMWDAFKAYLLYSKIVADHKQFYGSERLDYESSMKTINGFTNWLGAHYCQLAAAA